MGWGGRFRGTGCTRSRGWHPLMGRTAVPGARSPPERVHSPPRGAVGVLVRNVSPARRGEQLRRAGFGCRPCGSPGAPRVRGGRDAAAGNTRSAASPTSLSGVPCVRPRRRFVCSCRSRTTRSWGARAMPATTAPSAQSAGPTPTRTAATAMTGGTAGAARDTRITPSSADADRPQPGGPAPPQAPRVTVCRPTTAPAPPTATAADRAGTAAST